MNFKKNGRQRELAAKNCYCKVRWQGKLATYPKKLFGFICTLVLIAGVSSLAFGAFEDIGVSARARGMGGAFSSVTNDASAVYWNQASLARLKCRELTIFHDDMYGMGLLNYNFFGYAHPGIGKGTVAFGWSRMGTTGAVDFMNYSENTFMFGYGKKMTDRLYLGAGLKYFMVAYDRGASGIGGDASASYDLVIDKLTVAAIWRNLNRPKIRWETGATDDLEPTVNGGISYRFVPNHVVSLEVSKTLRKDVHLAAGWEGLFFNKILSLRAGAFELDKHINPTAGFGVTYKSIRFDYALEQHYALGLTSMFSLTIKFCPKLWELQKVKTEVSTPMPVAPPLPPAPIAPPPAPVAPPPPVETPKAVFQQIEEEAKNEKLEVKTENNKITITVRVNFDFGKSNIKNSEMPKVESVYRVLKNHTGTSVRIEGHTDSRGSEEYNQRLSEKRAREVMNELVKMGITAERLTYSGMGLTKPVASNLTKDGRYKNRRVEFEVKVSTPPSPAVEAPKAVVAQIKEQTKNEKFEKEVSTTIPVALPLLPIVPPPPSPAVEAPKAVVQIKEEAKNEEFEEKISASIPVAPPSPSVKTSKTVFQQIEEEAKNEKLEVRIENRAVVITVRVNFNSGKYNIKNSEMTKVKSVYKVLKNHTDMSVRVEGYTDNRGSEKYNKNLSEKRAKEVMNKLINMGISAERLTYSGMGSSKPVASNLKKDGRYKNRRVEFIIKR